MNDDDVPVYDDLSNMLRDLIGRRIQRATFGGRLFWRRDIDNFPTWWWEHQPGYMKLISPEDWPVIEALPNGR